MQSFEDPFAFITNQCRIPATQLRFLSSAPFFRHGATPTAADAAALAASAAHAAKFADRWPVSSPDDGVPLTDDCNEEIIFCTVPSTADNPDDVVPSRSDAFQVNTTTQLHGVVSGSSDGLGFGSVRKRVREENLAMPSPSAVMPSRRDVNDVVFADSDSLGFSAEGKRAGEKSPVMSPSRAMETLRVCGDVENTTTVRNDVVCENTKGLGLRCSDNSKGIQKDVVGDSSGDLGLKFSDSGDKIAVENTEEIENTAKMDCDTEEVTVIDDCKGKGKDKEKVIEDDKIDCDTEGVTVVDDCKGKGKGKEKVIVIEDDDDMVSDNSEEMDTSDCDTEICNNHVTCLMDIMKKLAERSRKDKKAGDGPVDFLETAKRRGYTFPKPRWMSS